MKVYNKLVRDRIPEIIEKNGQKCRTRTLDEAEYAMELRKKLREEVAEYEKDGGLEELADIMEVVRALSHAEGGNPDELEKFRMKKAGERGAFEERIFLESVE